MSTQNKFNNIKIKYRIPSIFIVLVIILVIIAIILIGFLSGLLEVEDLLLNFMGWISMLVAITTLAVVGAVLLGMYLGHRILSRRGFTPFEVSMLEMHEDIKDIKDRVKKLEGELKAKNKTAK